MREETEAGPRGRAWRVFYTKPRAEKKAEQALEERGLHAFLPKRTVLRQWKDRKKKVVEPLFPSYLFAHVDEAERLRVLQTPGIVRCVSMDGRPVTVPDDEIEQLRITQQGSDRLEPAPLPLPATGETVLIEQGPLAGLRGEVQGHRGQWYVVLRVESIRQAVRVHVPGSWVRRS